MKEKKDSLYHYTAVFSGTVKGRRFITVSFLRLAVHISNGERFRLRIILKASFPGKTAPHPGGGRWEGHCT